MKIARVSARTAVVAFAGLVGSAVVYTRSTGVLGGSPSERVAFYGLSGIAVVSAVVMLWAGMQFPRGAQRRQWTLLAIGMALWAAAEVIWSVMEVEMGLDPFPGIPDIFYLTAYAFMVLALVDVIRGYSGQVNIGRLAVVPVAVGIVATAALWTYLLADIFAYEEYGALEKLLSASYPLLDIWLQIVPALIIILIATKLGGESFAWPWAVLALGFVAIAVADVWWTYLDWQEAYAIGHVVDVLWMAGYTLLAVAASLAVDVRVAPAEE